jgi:hypothetical protein
MIAARGIPQSKTARYQGPLTSASGDSCRNAGEAVTGSHQFPEVLLEPPEIDTLRVCPELVAHLAPISDQTAPENEGESEGRWLSLSDFSILEDDLGGVRLIGHYALVTAIIKLALGEDWQRSNPSELLSGENDEKLGHQEAIAALRDAFLATQYVARGDYDSLNYLSPSVQRRIPYAEGLKDYMNDISRTSGLDDASTGRSERNFSLVSMDLLMERWLLHQLRIYGQAIDIVGELFAIPSTFQEDIEEGIDLKVFLSNNQGKLMMIGIDVVNSSRVFNENGVCIAGACEGEYRDRKSRHHLHLWQSMGSQGTIQPSRDYASFAGPTSWQRTGACVIPQPWYRYVLPVGIRANNKFRANNKYGYDYRRFPSQPWLTATRAAQTIYLDHLYGGGRDPDPREVVKRDIPVLATFREVLEDAFMTSGGEMEAT